MVETPQIRLFVLDRLIDDAEDDGPAGRAPQRQIGRLRDAVRRDLQDLLNTRKCWLSLDTELGEELKTSLFAYGLPDLHTLGVGSQHRDRLRRTIHEMITRYLPVFSTLDVVPLENIDPLDRALRFRISALLRLETEDQRIVFDSVLDPASRQFSVRSSDSV
jgi:type VI secretion system protein ImpF